MRVDFKSKLKPLYKEYTAKYPVFFKLVSSQISNKNNNLILGLDLSLSGRTKSSGISIIRGVELALEEINAEGGLLGKKLTYIAKDNAGFPNRGLENIKEFGKNSNIVGIMGGMHSPVAFKELKEIHKLRIPFLIPWAAATGIVNNKYNPNFVFRYSVRDEYAGEYLVKKALERSKKQCLFLENTKWGEGNLKAMTRSLKNRKVVPLLVERFNWGETNFSQYLHNAKKSKCQGIIFVGNSPEGELLLKTMNDLDSHIPIVSHWGITGGDFFARSEKYLKNIDLRFLQTFSFSQKNSPPEVKTFIKRYKEKYHLLKNDVIISPVGTIHSYELVKMLAKAIKGTKDINPDKLRIFLKNLKYHKGLFKMSNYPFLKNNDALTIDDFSMCKYSKNGKIVCEK